jgi:hypothetical protein
MMEDSSPLNDITVAKEILRALRDNVNTQDTAGIQRSTRQLLDACQPLFVMNSLAPSLFQNDSTSNFSIEDSLMMVAFLVSSDASHYLKPASRAVKDEALRLSKSDEAMIVSDNLLNVMVAQLSGNDVEVSENATEAILACCKKLGPPMSSRATHVITTTWRGVIQNSKTNRSAATTVGVRCASAIVDIICLGGDPAMEAALSSDAMAMILNMMNDSNDPLLQISTFDLIEKLVKTLPMHTLRAKWIFSDVVVDPLLQMVGAHGDEQDSKENEAADPFLGGPALRLLSCLCQLAHRDASLVDWDGDVGHRLLTGFHRALHQFSDSGSGELDRLALVDAISSFASASPDALDLVLDDPIIRQAWLSLASVAQPKLRSAILTSMAMVMNPTPEKDVNGDSTIVSNVPSTPLTMKLYSSLGLENNRDTTELVLTMAKSPIPELRLGAYNLLAAVARRGTGAQVLLSHGFGFLEFLMSRETENTKIGKEAKYNIVQAVMASEAKGLLADPIVRKLELYLKQGPYYLPTQSFELMTE